RWGGGPRLAPDGRSALTDSPAILPTAVDEDDRSAVVRLRLFRHRPIEAGDDGRRNATAGHRDRRGLVRRHQAAASPLDFPCPVRAVASDRDLFSFEERTQLLVRGPCPA